MIRNPLVVIKCMVYNHEPYLRECLEGFVMQKTNFPFVAIVHDDASTDNSVTIIREYSEKYPNIFIPIYEIENQYSKRDGTLRSIINNALESTKAKYVAWCEGDDYWIDPYKLQKQVDYMETHYDVGLCYTDYNKYEESTKVIELSLFEKMKKYNPRTYYQHLLKPGYLAPMTWMYRMELIKYINNNIKTHSDGSYAYMLEFMYNSKVAYLPEVTAVYRSHVGSASSPTDLGAQYRYSIGVFRTQIYYTEKYPCENELKHKVLMRGYLKKLPMAIKVNDSSFIQEVRSFMDNHDVDIDPIICDLRQGVMKQNSVAYKLGKIILYLFSLLKKSIRHAR